MSIGDLQQTDSILFRRMAEDIRAEVELVAAARDLSEAGAPTWRGRPVAELTRDELLEAVTYQHEHLREMVNRAAHERMREVAERLTQRIATAIKDALYV
ncbi:hypothetical protein JNW90_14885 [Micromonospora sp. STR1s_5]|nr:hypothetical protein [Micromonospora sp. STR1s_5]